MAKGFRGPTNNKTYKPEVQVREMPPRIQKTPDGMQVLCPFCAIPHPITIGQNAACGTKMTVMAVQTTYPVRTVNKYKFICLKCGQGSGEMIRYNNGYVHLADCAPSVKLLAEVPEFSRIAAIIGRVPKWLSAIVERYTGRVQEVKEIDSEGKETGKILGYFFLKREVMNGARPNPTTDPG